MLQLRHCKLSIYHINKRNAEEYLRMFMIQSTKLQISVYKGMPNTYWQDTSTKAASNDMRIANKQKDNYFKSNMMVTEEKPTK